MFSQKIFGYCRKQKTTQPSQNEAGVVVIEGDNHLRVLALLSNKKDVRLTRQDKINDRASNQGLNKKVNKKLYLFQLILTNRRVVKSIFFFDKKKHIFFVNHMNFYYLYHKNTMRKKCYQTNNTRKKNKMGPNRQFKNDLTLQYQHNIQYANPQSQHVSDSNKSQTQQKEEIPQFNGQQGKNKKQDLFSQFHQPIPNPNFQVSPQYHVSLLRQNEKVSVQNVNTNLKQISKQNSQNKTKKSLRNKEKQNKMQSLSFNALFKNKRITKKQSKSDDYHKNIPLATVRAFRRYLLQDSLMMNIVEKEYYKKKLLFSKFRQLLDGIKICRQLSLTKLKNKFLDPKDPIKQIFKKHYKYFLEQRYVYYLLDDSKIKHIQKYIDYIHRYLVNLGQIN